jgi:lysophospholipase L1-like esterase
MLTVAPTTGVSARLLAAYVAAQLCWVAGSPQFAAADDHAAASDFYLRDGDRVVFYGDSITEQGHYTLPIETFVVTRCPGMNVSFINRGWSGDRAWGGEGGMLEERLRRDVIALRPTVVTVMLGMNDGYYTDFSPQAVTAFNDSLETLVVTLERELPGVRITLLGTSPYDDVTPGDQPDWVHGIEGGYGSVVARFSQATCKVAKRHDLLFVDMNEPLVALQERAQATNPELARQLIPDRIHPGSAAGLVMAARLLAAWKAPLGGHSIHVDATGAAGGVCRVRLELSLPFPIDRDDALTKLVLQSPPDVLLVARDTLRVTHLPFARASLQIDGGEAGDYSAEQLARGIDFSALDTPLARRAAEVAKLIRLRNRLQFSRWRDLQMPFPEGGPANVKKTAEELAAIERELVAIQQLAARPAPHSIEIVAAEANP